MNNIYIPDNLILVRSEDCKEEDAWIALYGLENDFHPTIFDFDYSYYYNGTHIPIKHLRENWSKISKGIIPESCKKFIKIVPNRPFLPKIQEVWWEGDRAIIKDEIYNINFYDPSRNITFGMIDHRDNNSILLRLGVDGGRVIKEAVIVFKYYSRDSWDKKCTKFPYNISLISLDDPTYEEAMRDSDEIRKFYSNGVPKFSDLIPGHFYRKKGYITNTGEHKDLDKIVVYLGEGWKIANGEHVRSPFSPGDRFSRFPMFIEMSYLTQTSTGLLHPSTIAKICSFPVDHLLCPLPEFDPLPDFEIDSLKERFEASMWSQKFWKTPGIIKNFHLMREFDSISEPAEGRNKGAVRTYELITKKMYDDPDNITSLEAIKFKGGGDNWISDYNVDYNYFPITIDCSDKSLPLQLRDSSSPGKTTLNYLGGADWMTNSRGGYKIDQIKKEKYLIKNGCGIEYYTSDGRFIFRDVADFLTHPCVRLALTGEGDYKSWRIADPTMKELNRLIKLRK